MANNYFPQSSPSWNNFVNTLEIANKVISIKWNHQRELIMLDDRKKTQIFLKEIFHYNCDDPLKMIEENYHKDNYDTNLLVTELKPFASIQDDDTFNLIIERQEKLEITRKLIDNYLHFLVQQNFTIISKSYTIITIVNELKKLHKTEAILHDTIVQCQNTRNKMKLIKDNYLIKSIKVALKKQKMKTLIKMKEFSKNYLNKWIVLLKETKVIKKKKFHGKLFNQLGSIKYNISTWSTSNPITLRRNLMIIDALMRKIKVKMEKVQINFNDELKSIFIEKKNSIEEIYDLFAIIKTVQFQNPYDEFITNILITFKKTIMVIIKDSLFQNQPSEHIVKFSQLKILRLSEQQFLASIAIMLRRLIIVAECYHCYMIIPSSNNKQQQQESNSMIRQMLYDKRELFYSLFEKKITKVLKNLFLTNETNFFSSKANFILIMSYISLFSECLRSFFVIETLKELKTLVIDLIREQLQKEVKMYIKKNANMLNGDNWKRLALSDKDEIFTLSKYPIHISYKHLLTIINNDLKENSTTVIINPLSLKEQFIKFLDNPTIYSKGKIELSILSKPLSNLSSIYSSSSYSLIKSILELITNTCLYESLTSEVFQQIFNLFDYYFLATLSMRMMKKSYLAQIFETVDIEDVKKKNTIGLSTQFALFLEAHVDLRKHILNITKNLGELFNIKIDHIAGNYNDDTKAFFIPKLNSQILINETNFYCLLIESIVLVESIISSFKFIKRLNKFIKEDNGSQIKEFNDKIFQYKKSICQLRSFLYKPICAGIFNLDALQSKIQNHKWEINEDEAIDFSTPSGYIDLLLEEIFEKYDKLNLLSGGSITSQAQLRFFDVLMSHVIDRLIDSVSRIKKSNSTGRSILLKDIKLLKGRIEETLFQLHDKKINLDHYFNKLLLYINAWYYTEEELFAYVKESKLEYQYAFGIIFNGNSFASMNKKIKKEKIDKLDKVYYEIIEKINRNLISN